MTEEVDRSWTISQYAWDKGIISKQALSAPYNQPCLLIVDESLMIEPDPMMPGINGRHAVQQPSNIQPKVRFPFLIEPPWI